MNDAENLTLTTKLSITPELSWTPAQVHAACSLYNIIPQQLNILACWYWDAEGEMSF